MPVAKLTRWGLGLWCGLCLGLAACGGGGTPAATSGAGDVAATAVPAATAAPADTGDSADSGDSAAAATPTAAGGVPATVPVLVGATDLKVTTDGSYIAYKAAITYDDAVAFYQAELVAQGWEQINKNDAEFGGSTTLLRTRPEANISVTIQTVAGDDNAVRVLISLSKK